MEVPEFEGNGQNSDAHQRLVDAHQWLAESQYPFDDHLGRGRFLDDLLLNTVEEFPDLNKRPVEINIGSVDLLQEYTGALDGARVLLHSVPRAWRDQDAGPGSSSVVLYLPVENTFPSGLIFTASALNGVKVVSFGDEEKNKRLANFIEKFKDDQAGLTEIACELAKKATAAQQ